MPVPKPMSMSMHTPYVRFEELEELVSPFWSMNETLEAMNGASRRSFTEDQRAHSTSALDRPTFLNSLANRSLCFLGPANTSCAVQRELCSACEVLFITNNMVTLIEAMPCLSMVLVTNRFFGHRVLANSA